MTFTDVNYKSELIFQETKLKAMEHKYNISVTLKKEAEHKEIRLMGNPNGIAHAMQELTSMMCELISEKTATHIEEQNTIAEGMIDRYVRTSCNT
jgi:hypothetical protein